MHCCHIIATPIDEIHKRINFRLLQFPISSLHSAYRATCNMTSDPSVFDSLPKFDASSFQPPAWANGPAFDFTKKNGESSKSGQRSPESRPSQPKWSSAFDNDAGGAGDIGSDEEDEDEEVWEDAKDSMDETVEDTPEGLVFTTKELKVSPASANRG